MISWRFILSAGKKIKSMSNTTGGKQEVMGVMIIPQGLDH
jgi:hypothetical protein